MTSLSQLFLIVIQWWNKRVLQSLFFADTVGSPPCGAVKESLFSLLQLEKMGAWAGAESAGWGAASRTGGQCQKEAAKKVNLKKKKIFHCKNPFYQNIQRVCSVWEGRQRIFRQLPSKQAQGRWDMHTGGCLCRQCIWSWQNRQSRKPVSHVGPENNSGGREPFQFSSPLMPSVDCWSPTQVEFSLSLIIVWLFLNFMVNLFFSPCIPCIGYLLFCHCVCSRRIWLLLCTPSLDG